MIEEILDRMAALDRRMAVVEQTTRALLAQRNAAPAAVGDGPLRISMNGKPAATISAPGAQASSTSVPGGVRFGGRQAQKPAEQKKPKVQIKPAPNARVEAKIRDEEGKPVPEVEVTIYDARNNVVKQTRTNRAGLWMAFLSPGKYGAECVLEGKVNENVIFTVKPGEDVVKIPAIPHQG